MALMDEEKTVKHLAVECALPERPTAMAVIRMHHLGLIKPSYIEGEGTYWVPTKHSLEHATQIEGCFGCVVRQELCMANAAFVE